METILVIKDTFDASATSIVNYIEFIGYDENGNLVEYTESYSRPDKLEVRFGTNDI